METGIHGRQLPITLTLSSFLVVILPVCLGLGWLNIENLGELAPKAADVLAVIVSAILFMNKANTYATDTGITTQIYNVFWPSQWRVSGRVLASGAGAISDPRHIAVAQAQPRKEGLSHRKLPLSRKCV